MSKEQITFEQAMARLEQIVSSLDSGRLSLDASLELFAEGAELIKLCSRSLDEAALRLEELFPQEKD